MILTACRGVAFLVGVMAFYVGLFLCESQEGKFQNRIEELWIAIDDRAKVTGNRAAALFNKVAAVASGALDRILGPKLVSAQMIGVSSSYAFAGFFLTGGFVFAFLLHRLRALPSLPTNLPPNMDFNLSLITAFCLFVGVMLFVLAALPSILPSALSRFLSLLPCSVFLLGIVQMVRKHLPLNGQFEMLAALLLSLLSDVGLFVVVRQSIRWISVQVRPLRVCLAISGQIALIFLIVWLPQEISGRLSVKYGWKIIPQFLVMISGFNIFTAIAACIFILALSGVLIHRLFWPFVGRLFYQIARYRVVRNHRAMASLGAICMIFAFPSLRGLVAGILGWLVTVFSGEVTPPKSA